MTSPEPSLPDPSRRLRRSADRRIAGVAGGVAANFGLDATLVRIAFVVLSFFGGAGLALYALGVFVLPDADGAPPLSTGAKLGVLAIAVAAVCSIPFAGAAALVLLVPAAIGVLVWRLFGGHPPERLVRAAVVVLALGGAVVVGLGAGVAAAFGAGTAIAVAVIALGLGLVFAALRGGARWLIVPAFLLALPASVVSAADLRLEGGVGEREYRPSAASDVRPLYRLGVGALTVDLRDVDFAAESTVPVKVRVGVGDLQVSVPEDVCVRTVAHAGMGAVDLLGRDSEGVDVDAERGGVAAPGQATLVLDLHTGAGAIRVNHRPDDLDGHRGARGDRFRGDLVSDGCEG